MIYMTGLTRLTYGLNMVYITDHMLVRSCQMLVSFEENETVDIIVFSSCSVFDVIDSDGKVGNYMIATFIHSSKPNFNPDFLFFSPNLDCQTAFVGPSIVGPSAEHAFSFAECAVDCWIFSLRSLPTGLRSHCCGGVHCMHS